MIDPLSDEQYKDKVKFIKKRALAKVEAILPNGPQWDVYPTARCECSLLDANEIAILDSLNIKVQLHFRTVPGFFKDSTLFYYVIVDMRE